MLRLVPTSYDLNPTYLARNCSSGSFHFIDHTWKAARAELTARWERIVFTRRYHRLRRDRIKASYRYRNSHPQLLPLELQPDFIWQSVGIPVKVVDDEVDSVGSPKIPLTLPTYLSPALSVTPTLFAEEKLRQESVALDQPYASGIVPCLEVFDVNVEALNSAQEGFATGILSTTTTRLTQDHRSVDPMEKNSRASAASRSSHCQRNEKLNGLTPEQYLEKKKAEGVALVMAMFNKWLDKRLNVITYAYETAGASGNPTADGSTGSQGSGGNGQSERSSRRPKRQLDGSDPNNSSSGGDENGQDRGGNKRAKKNPEAGRRFACPFYKHDPRTYIKQKTCCGPGWDTIHRLKEHLYRKHRLLKHACVRCGERFASVHDLNEHLRADVRCEKVDIGPVDGIDEEMMQKLKVRKSSSRTDEQRWRDIYLILFPKASCETVPSPYYDSNDGLELAKSAAQWKKNERLIRKELPRYVQKKVEHSYNQVNIDIARGLFDIVRDGIYELLGPGADISPTESPAGSPKPSAAEYHNHAVLAPEARPPTDNGEEEGNSTLLDLGSFFDVGDQPFGLPPALGSDLLVANDFDYNFGGFLDCDGNAFDAGSDSGYASGSTGGGGVTLT